MTTTRVALFDVDGTLADTNPLHVVAWWEALRQAGHRVPTAAVHAALGLPGQDLVAHLLGPDRDTDRATDGDAALAAAHATLYGTCLDRLAPQPGAADLLRAVAAQGRSVVLVTSAAAAELTALRRALDADDVIAHTASADDVAVGKPAPEPVEHALRLAGAAPEHAVLVGDSVWDMEAATRAGVPAIGLLCGGVARADLEAAGAREIHRDPAALLARLDSSLLAAGSAGGSAAGSTAAN